MKIAIVGAGLGGLAAATCLAKAGHSVVVFERQSCLSPIGGIIALRPSALKVLYAHGLRDKIDKVTLPLGESQFRMLRDGRVVKTVDLYEDAVEGEGLSLVTTRPELAGVLLQAAREVGVDLRYDTVVRGFKEDGDGVRVFLEDGEIVENVDLLLAADGIRSRLGEKVLEESHEPTLTDAIFYVVNGLPAALLAPDFKDRISETHGPWIRITYWQGQDSWGVSAYDHVQDTVDIGVTIVEPTSQTRLWDEDGNIEYAREYFATRAHGDLREVLEQTQDCARWRLAYMPSLPRWSSRGRRVALLVDATPAILPNGGTGITLTIEDVGALNHVLERYGTEGVPEALRVWEKACKPRPEKLMEYGIFNMRRLEGDKTVLMETEKALKEEAMGDRKAAKPDMDAQWSTLSFARWLSGYDPINVVEECHQQE